MQNILEQELDKIDELPKQGLKWVEYSAYALGLNIAPRKRGSGPCRFLRIFTWIVNMNIIYSLIKFIIVNFVVSFEAYVEAVLLTFQLSVGLVKMMMFFNNLESCVDLVRITETGSVLKDLGLFDLILPNKRKLCTDLKKILYDNWQEIDRQVMFFYKIVCMPVLYYTLRPYFQYLYDCYIVRDTCEMTLTYPAIVPYIQLGNYQLPSYSVRFFLLQSGPFWCFFAVFGFNSLFVVLTRHVACLIKILRYLVKHSTDNDTVRSSSRVLYLRCCVRLFSRISRHHAQIENLFKYIILVQCTISSILICMLLYKISTVLEVSMVWMGMIMVYLLTITLEISLYNVNAQKVETQSELLFEEWYNCAWYNETEEFKFMIKLMLLFSKRTFILSVGGFTNLSHKFLVQVFRMSGNFFLLLQNMNNK
ncbi:odorant receptor 67b [Drosophila busckii]|uniref:odorant receptor 67b n=1 Tax=Drosophila busckii TaxID=30019 RepID=UPI00143302B7|nr:odorant receptor 67b [Drosophila busckii]